MLFRSIHKYRVGLYARAAKKHGMPRLREALALSRKTDAAAKSNMGGDAYVLLELLLAETLAKK